VQLATPAALSLSVQLVLPAKLPEPEVLKLTAPVGVLCATAAESVTVALHVVLCEPASSELGAHSRALTEAC
jgi:hypothetical protein